MSHHVEDFAHVIYRYRVSHGIAGDDHGDKEMAREFLEHCRRGDQRTIDKFIVDTFRREDGTPDKR